MELTEKCPYCEQPITRQQLDAIRARIREEEQARLRSMQAATQKELEEKYRRELEVQKQALKKQQDEAILKANAQFTREREAFQRKIKDLERQVEKKTANDLMGTPAPRLFVPLLGTAFDWFLSGRKRWEVRRCRRQYTPKHVVRGREVELRRGYSGQSLWGIIGRHIVARTLLALFERVDFKEVVPQRGSKAEARRVCEGILGRRGPYIAFEVLRLGRARRSRRARSFLRSGYQEADCAATHTRAAREAPRTRVSRLSARNSCNHVDSHLSAI